MKSVKYEYTLKELAGMIATMEMVPDGWWDLAVSFEQLATMIPAISGQQDPNPYPGAMARVLGLILVPSEPPPDKNWYPHAIEVRGGRVIMERNNDNPGDQGRPEPDSPSPRGHIRAVN